MLLPPMIIEMIVIAIFALALRTMRQIEPP
jgi:hypothetical protein